MLLTWFRRLAALLGITGLDFGLSARDRTRLLYASAFTVVAIAALAIQVTVRIAYGSPSIFGGDWSYRIYTAAAQVQSLAIPVGVAALFVAAIAPVSRPLASWAALIACAFVVVAIVCGVFATYVVLDTRLATIDVLDFIAMNKALTSTISGQYVDVARSALSISSFLSIGYAFLAYRGLNRTTQLTRPRKVREHDAGNQPREL